MFDMPDPVPRVPWHHSTVTTDDGCTLAVQSAGAGPAVLLANGIGVTAPGLDGIAEHLRRDGHRVVCWDYRGMGRSRAPAGVEFTMPRHALDALQVLDALGEPKAAVLGWSMGVPVGCEMIRRAADRVVAFGVLFGSPAAPFRAAFPRPVSDLVHLSVAVARYVSPLPAQTLLRIGLTIPPLAWHICTAINFCGDRANREVFMEHVRSTTESDKTAYFTTMYEMMYHDARDMLPSIRCPVLVVAGEKDWVTPPEAAAEMARLIPGARHVFFPETSHFGVIEHGPSLWGPIDQLLEDAGWTPQAAARPGDVAGSAALG